MGQPGFCAGVVLLVSGAGSAGVDESSDEVTIGEPSWFTATRRRRVVAGASVDASVDGAELTDGVEEPASAGARRTNVGVWSRSWLPDIYARR